MVKKIISKIILVLMTMLVIIVGYYFIMDIESRPPQVDEVKIETEKFMGRKIFKLSPQNGNNSGKVILYFHGGAYMAEATNNHWEFLEKLVKDTNSTVIMPDYPLTPKYTYKDVMNMVEPVYKNIIAQTDSNNLIMMGDSAGGGIALGLAEKISKNNIPMPSKTILISPWLDTSMSNSRIPEVQKKDKDLSKEKLLLAAASYSRGITEEDNYFVNPLNGNLSKLKNITIYTGTYDILNPDCYVLKDKAKEQGVDIEIKEYETAPHIWMINNNDELANKAYEDLLQNRSTETRNQLTVNMNRRI